MSYLDVPRIQFGGLFFTDPDTINNTIGNYDPTAPLNPLGWNPVGVARLWLAECSVLSVVGPTGTLVTDPHADPLIGAAVESPSPATPKPRPDGKGNYDVAKLVDLDPLQQLRSAVYGLRLYVALAGGAGFSGLMTVPELQYLNGRMQLGLGSWSAVGTWMGQIAEVTWNGDLSASPFLRQFQAACGQGIAVKLTVDLHQNDPASRGVPGNQFCYGRVHGSLGPIGAGELPQVVPGRQVQVPQAPAPGPAPAQAFAAATTLASAAAPAKQVEPKNILGVTKEERLRNLAAQLDLASPAPAAAFGAPPAPPAPPAPWNPAPAQVTAAGAGTAGALLHLDLGGSIWIDAVLDPSNGIGKSDGKFVVDTGIAVGFQNAAGVFQALTNGQVSFAGQYQLLNSQNKQVNLVQSAGLVDIPLTPDEASLVAAQPLVIQVSGVTVLQEPADGLLLGTEPLSLRLEPATSGHVQLMARGFGQPIVGQQPLTWQISDSAGAPSTEIAIAWVGATDANGLASLAASTPPGDVALPPARQPLDTQLYLVFFFDPTGEPVGDGYGQGQQANASLSVLRFQSFAVPAQPTWNQDVGPILEAYARLYPGMKAILDIGNEVAVQGAAPFIYGRMSLPIQEPAYMPVTRDLAPARIQTVLKWLQGFLPGAGS
jgi:hypothetical protein